MSIEEKVRSLRMRIRFHLNRMQAEQADAEILEFAREIERDALERAAGMQCHACRMNVTIERMGSPLRWTHQYANGRRTPCAAWGIRSLIPAEPEEAK